VYTYYTGEEAYGGPVGALKTAAVTDGATVLDTEYYRYYVPAAGPPGPNPNPTPDTGLLLKYAFRGPAYARLVAAVGSNLDAVPDAAVAPYADHYFEYDEHTRRVTREVAAGAGGAGTNGFGEFTYTYAHSTFTAGANRWDVRTEETLPNGSSVIVYTNAYGAPLLRVFHDVVTQQSWSTYYRYNDDGRLELVAYPSAVTGYSDAYADLMNVQGASRRTCGTTPAATWYWATAGR
jgi:hypothetical protein